MSDEPEIYLDQSPCEIPLPIKLNDIENIEGRSLEVIKHFSMYITDIVNNCDHKHNIKTLNSLSKCILAIFPKISKAEINEVDCEQLNAKKYLLTVTKSQMKQTTMVIESIKNLKDHESDPIPCPTCKKDLKLKTSQPGRLMQSLNEDIMNEGNRDPITIDLSHLDADRILLYLVSLNN